MSSAAIRTAIVSVISGVADIGRVHAYRRYTTSLADFKPLHFSATHNDIRSWQVSRYAYDEVDPLAGAHGVETTRWEIHGYLSVDDANQSELTLDALVESLRAAFKADRTLGGTVDDIILPDRGGKVGLQLEAMEHVMFADVLCHRAKCALFTWRATAT